MLRREPALVLKLREHSLVALEPAEHAPVDGDCRAGKIPTIRGDLEGVRVRGIAGVFERLGNRSRQPLGWVSGIVIELPQNPFQFGRRIGLVPIGYQLPREVDFIGIVDVIAHGSHLGEDRPAEGIDADPRSGTIQRHSRIIQRWRGPSIVRVVRKETETVGLQQRGDAAIPIIVGLVLAERIVVLDDRSGSRECRGWTRFVPKIRSTAQSRRTA